MAQAINSVLKGYFNAGDEPTEAQFATLIDSSLNLALTTNQAATGSVEFTGGHLNTVVLSGGGTTTLTAANAGATCVFDTAATSNFTLPAPDLGMRFDFIQVIINTADHVIQAATDGHGFLGGVVMTNTTADQTDTFSTATDGSDDFITINATTTGGAAAGSMIHVAAMLGTSAAKTWAVSGTIICSGAGATPFAASQI